MPLPINLFKAFEKGYIPDTLLAVESNAPWSTANYGTVQPPPGKKWLILGGYIDHITASVTQISIGKRNTAPNVCDTTEILTLIAAATASGDYPLYCAETGAYNGVWRIAIVDVDEMVVIGGGTACGLHLKVLEWE
jgi:hypothetical protein